MPTLANDLVCVCMQVKMDVRLGIAQALETLADSRRLLRPALACMARYVHACLGTSRLLPFW